MGSQPSKFLQNLDKNYEQTDLKHPLYRRSAFFKRKGVEQFIVHLIHKFVNAQDYDICVREYQQRINSPHENVVTLFSAIPSTQQTFCSTTQIIQAYYELVPYTLRQDISGRAGKGKFYDSAEASFIFVSILKGMTFLHSKKIFQRQLNSSRIVLSTSKKVKIIDKMATEGFLQRQQRSLEQQLQLGFVDPSFLQLMSSKKTQTAEFDPFLSDSWSVGLIMLQVFTLKNSIDIYNMRTYSLKSQVLKERISQALGRYKDYASEIKGLLKQESYERSKLTDCLFNLERLRNRLKQQPAPQIRPYYHRFKSNNNFYRDW